MDDWIPWGNAPKDKAILAWLGDPYDYPEVIEWNADLGCWAWRESNGFPGDNTPTHWMPLPPKPST